MLSDYHVICREPQVPPRDSSLEAAVMSKDDIVYLAGRKEHDPACKRFKNFILTRRLNNPVYVKG